MEMMQLSMLYELVVKSRPTRKKIVSIITAIEEARKQIPLQYEDLTFFSVKDIWVYHAVFDTKLCILCQRKTVPFTYSGLHLRREFPWLEIETNNRIGAWVHPNCLKPDTLVHTSKGLTPIADVALGDWVLTHKGRYRQVIQLHKNEHNGDLYNINGNWMTDNHPVLTDKGWVRADFLDSVVDKTFQLISPMTKTNERPPLRSEVISFPLIPFTMFSGAMPMSTVDFDGEFGMRNSEVNIEDVNGIQRNHLYSRLFEYSKEKLFKLRHLGFGLNSLRSPNKKIMRLRNSSHRIMGTLDLIGSLLIRHLTPLQGFCFASSSNNNFSPLQSELYSTPTTLEVFSDSIDRPTQTIKFINHIDRQIQPQFSHLTTSTINNIDKERYKGYVHNLSVYEDESYLIGDRGLVVHNCRCYLQRDTPESPDITPRFVKMKRKLKRVKEEN